MKMLCRQKTHIAIKKGILIKNSCIDCGNKKVQAHHKDYNNPLEVIWLCVKHHSKLHKLNL